MPSVLVSTPKHPVAVVKKVAIPFVTTTAAKTSSSGVSVDVKLLIVLCILLLFLLVFVKKRNEPPL